MPSCHVIDGPIFTVLVIKDALYDLLNFLAVCYRATDGALYALNQKGRNGLICSPSQYSPLGQSPYFLSKVYSVTR